MKKYLYIVFLFLLCPFSLFGQVSYTLEKIVDGCQFTEGPVWSTGNGLYFSDINGNTVYFWQPGAQKKAYITSSAGANGLAFDNQGRLVMCLQGGRKVVRRESSGTITVLASTYGGKKLNSPNDLVIATDGGIFFTDPPYGLNGQASELGYSGVFHLDTNGYLRVIDKTLIDPNGIAFTPDHKHLYVDDTENRRIYEYDVVNDTDLTNKRLLITIGGSGGVDGMKTDSSGIIYCASPTGISVITPAGQLLGTIIVPGQTTNCNWGNDDRKTLYITAGTAVYRCQPKITGIKDAEPMKAGAFSLSQNYPNPFNPTCKISFSLTDSEYISLRVYNASGKLVETLINGMTGKGEHVVTFDGSKLSSGIYYYMLSDNKTTLSRQMVLVK